VPPFVRSDKGTALGFAAWGTEALFFALTPSPSPTAWERDVGRTAVRPDARSPSAASRERGLWSAEAQLPPTLKLTLQHSKQVRARLPSPTAWERDVGRTAVRPDARSPSAASRARGTMECGSEASAHAEAHASALQTGPRAAPLSHDVGEGCRGARRCALMRVPPLPPRGRGGYGVRKRSFRPR
jgi:hypothetical protein